MNITFATDDLNRITCLLERDKVRATATSSAPGAAIEEMHAAIVSVEANGLGECFWLEGGGEYRWVFRREGSNVRVAVLWTSGVMSGWEHVFWAECPMEPVMVQLKAGLAAVETWLAGRLQGA